MKKLSTHEHGFAIPITMITAFALILLMLALLQSIVSMRTFTDYSYYSKLSEEAAEAGTAYASACLEVNERRQTWGNTTSSYLTESSDCTGNQSAFVGSTLYGTNASIPIHFTVGNIEVTPNSVNIAAHGSADMPSSSVPVTNTINRSITWITDLVSQRSVSGTYRTCGILSGSVYCWGHNQYGQLGNNATIDTLTPVKVYKEAGVLSGKLVSDIFAAQDHNCAISEGEVYCWGRNNYGQLGDGTTQNSAKPKKVGGALAGKVVTKIGGTSYASCAIAEGKIYCWGYNSYGTVGNNTTTTSFKTPVLVATSANGVSNGLPAGYNATALTSGSRSTNMCAIADGLAYCWGPNKAGQIGNNTTPGLTIYKAPTAVYTGGVLSGKTITAISQDGYSDAPESPSPPPYAHVCVVADSKAYCWGENTSGQLGNATKTDTKAPVAVSTAGVLAGKTIVDIELGLEHSCALTSEGKVYCWGQNSSGQVGDNTTIDRSSPVSVYEEIGILKNVFVSAIGAGANRGCAIVNNGRSYCWGHNNGGQIGDGTTTNRYKPTESIFLRTKNNNFIY